MKQLIILACALSLVLAGCQNKPAFTTEEQSDELFTFAFLTDIHLQPELNAIQGYKKAIDTINKLNPDFVLTGGDLIMDALGQTYGRSDSLYQMYKELNTLFEMPVYNTLGNHEVFGWYREEPEITGHPEFGKKMYEKQIGERFYSFDHKGWHFIVLDAISRAESGGYFGKIEEEQIEWLKEDLQAVDRETPIAVSVHIPFITSQAQLARGSLAQNSEGLVITNSKEVLDLFMPYKLKLVLQGHLHFLEDIYVMDQVHFITAGAVSGRWWGNKPDSHPQEGFLLVKAKKDDIEWEYVDFNWTTEFE